eukprot:PhF_6_TR30408/c0_g1_i1/m.44597/K08288/PRKCSH; protein kinase C substrate 80K-H
MAKSKVTEPKAVKTNTTPSTTTRRYAIVLVFVFAIGGVVTHFALERNPAIRQKIMTSLNSIFSSSSSSTFRCGIREFPISRKNDGYCDCLDGSDEDRTSACSATIPLQSSRKFLCRGASPIDPHQYIHTSRVCDGVCDCCDGSDETSDSCAAEISGGKPLVKCQSRCEEIANTQTALRQSRDAQLQRWRAIRTSKYTSSSPSDVADVHADITAQIQFYGTMVNQSINISQDIRRRVEKNETQMTQQLYEYYRNLRNEIGYYQFQQRKAKSWLSPQVIGKEFQYLPLVGKCFSILRHEKVFRGGSAEPVHFNATFTLCPFDNITQYTHDNQNKTVLLGHFVGWGDLNFTIVKDDDRRVVPGVLFHGQHYTHGEDCWQGPDRTTSVLFVCGGTDE